MVGCDAHDGSHASAITYSDVLKTGEDRTMIVIREPFIIARLFHY